MSDKPVYPDMVSGLHSETIKKIHHYMVADLGYNDQGLYDKHKKKDFSLYIVHRYRKTPPEERLKLVDFFINRL